MRQWMVFAMVFGLLGLAFWALNSSHTTPAEKILEAIEDTNPSAPPVVSSDSKTVAGADTNQQKTDSHQVGIVEPDGYRMEDYRSPVPASLQGAKVIDVEEAWPAWQNKSAVFIDVYPRAPKPPNLPKNTIWREPVHMSIEGAEWLANVGYGVLAPHVEHYFKSQLKRLTRGDKNKPIIFFCLRDCWMSWNAGKRAVAWGYTNVLWFSEGTDAWQEAGHDLVPIDVVKIDPAQP
jgi:PQQ-dependent catabolism-associated CXXCW motif protein